MPAVLLLWLCCGAAGLAAAGEAVDSLHWPAAAQRTARDEAPRPAQKHGCAGGVRDDAAFCIHATFRDDPPQALVYAWSWALPVCAWSTRGRALWGHFRSVHRKAFTRREPPPEQWWLVEVDLRRDFAARFPRQPLPVVAGTALKADSNHTPGDRSLAWLRSITLHHTSLCCEGFAGGGRVGDALLWFL